MELEVVKDPNLNLENVKCPYDAGTGIGALACLTV